MPFDTAAPPDDLSPAAYLDILITELDRSIRLDITSPRAKHLMGPMRRILVRMADHARADRPLAENLAGATATDGTPEGLWRAALREADALDAVEARVDARLADVAEPLSTAEGEVNLEAVEAWLRRSGHPDARVTTFRKLDGGRSKETILLEATGLVDLPAELVIRRDLISGVVGTTVEDEYRLLVALTDRGFEAPRPFKLESDSSAIGTPFMLMARAGGGVICDVMDAPADPKLILQAARALGTLHSYDAAELAHALPAHAQARPVDVLVDDLVAAREAWTQNSREPSAIMLAALDWLDGYRPQVAPLSAIVHGDFSFHNLLYDGDALSAVLDWELARIGHPAEDLGYFRVLTSSQDLWPRFMDAYREAGGPDIQDRDIAFFGILGALKLLTLLFRARLAFESGMVADIGLADVTIFHLPRILHKISLELRRLEPEAVA